MMNEETYKQLFKQFNRLMVLLWRLGLGNWVNFYPEGVGRIMVLTHTGRKSGLRRRTPVNYAVVDGELYCLAGFGASTDWLKNILANPEVQVWLPDGWWRGIARLVEDDPIRLPVIRQVLINSGFAAKTFEGVHPRELNEAELEQVAKDYCLVHIHRTAAMTGADGPGDLAWIWAAIVHGLLVLWLIRKIFRKKS